MQEASMVGEVARSTFIINAALDDNQEEYQPTMIELEGNISIHSVSILVGLGACLSYVNPKIMEKCHLQMVKFRNPPLVQLATRAKWRVNAKIEICFVKIGQQIKVDLNVLPLGSYDVLIGMDWLEKQWSLVDCKVNTINFIDEGGIR